MIDQMTMDTHAGPSSRPRLPLQAAPIDRSQSPASAVAGGAGVEADIDVEDIIKVAGPLLGTLGSFFSDRALKRDITPVGWSR
jgi:hypothetical protein